MDITKVPLKLLRESIGYVPQDNFLFSSSIKSNIGFTPVEPDIDEIRRAARISQIDHAIMELPDKYDTMLGERGLTYREDRNRGFLLPEH